jgi:hypothetical protein
MDRQTREAVRRQIVAHHGGSSGAIAAALDLPHEDVVDVMRSFARRKYIELDDAIHSADRVDIVSDSLSERFRDLSRPL